MAWASTFDVFLNSYVVKIIAQAVQISSDDQQHKQTSTLTVQVTNVSLFIQFVK